MSGEPRPARGRAFGKPAEGAPDLEVSGDDRDLARAVQAHPGSLVRWSPATGDLARALGIRGPLVGSLAVPVDGLWWSSGSADQGPASGLGLNVVVLGPAPDRLSWRSPMVRIRLEVDGRERFAGPAATVVIANGQWLRRAELSPRGHPGDGRAEIQVYSLPRGQRRAMRSRLGSGSHLDHPRIAAFQGHSVTVGGLSRPLALEVDGGGRARRVDRLEVRVEPALRLLV